MSDRKLRILLILNFLIFEFSFNETEWLRVRFKLNILQFYIFIFHLFFSRM